MASQSVAVGDMAPDFAIPLEDGETIRLSDFRGKSDVVLFFYPKDNSPACTAEACSFRDSYEAFRVAGAEVVGISADSADSHQRFSKRLRLPFYLVSDQGNVLRNQYGVPRTLGLIPGRATYLIDRQGKVRHIFASQFQVFSHVPEALRALKALREEELSAGAEPEAKPA